ncbi:hypothetical protein [Nannocystis bainbridge]|uniref:Uncharacterized protein n=1 Tax=Nannocystis bainbridge TaxID=2995303 RepID=A0ABT5DXW3_9BACT|nr:hypothetical protein [Nannocystis bainbridge]MDC0717939.1 hypothetical protein [Nannocystis bainbridge]
MIRNILMVCSVLSSLAVTPAMARPLVAPSEPAQGGGQFGPSRPDQGAWNQGLDSALLLQVCTQTQIFVGTGSNNRAYDCDTLTGPFCLAQCADEIEGDTCRSQCDDGGALFCAPSELTARWGGLGGWGGFGPWGGNRPGIGPWDDRPGIGDIDEELIFIDTSTCLQLDLQG